MYTIEKIADLIAQMTEDTRLRVRVDANPYSISLANAGDAIDFFSKMQMELPEAMELILDVALLPSVGNQSYMKMIAPFEIRRES